MIPLRDDNPTSIPPVVTVAIIVVCSAVFLWQQSLSPGAAERAVYAYGAIPAVILGGEHLPASIASVSPWLTILTSMFLHGGWLHIVGNMLYLWIFGNNIEDAMGHARFVVFYLLCGTAAALTRSFMAVHSGVPMIGASGAIAGVLGAYLVLYPHARVLVLVPLGFFTQLVRLPALWVLGFWFALQFIQSGLAPNGAGGVASWAHIGGFAAGAALIVLFRRRSSGATGWPPRDRRRGPWG